MSRVAKDVGLRHAATTMDIFSLGSTEKKELFYNVPLHPVI